MGHMPVIPATQEAKAGESLEPRRQRLQWAKITPLHSSLGGRARLRLKKKKQPTDKYNELVVQLSSTLKTWLWETGKLNYSQEKDKSITN